MTRFATMLLLVALSGCDAGGEPVRRSFSAFLEGCKVGTVRYDIGQEAGTRAMLVQCVEGRQL